MTRFKPGRCHENVARVRQRDRATAKRLNGEQKHERDAFQYGLLHTPTAARVLPRAYARKRRSIRRSCRSGSSRFGVSIILTTFAKRGSRMMRRNGSGPIL